MIKTRITNATLQDVDTMLIWGNTHRELWSSEKDGWYTRKMLEDWIKSNDGTIFVAKEGETLAGMCFVDLLHGWAYCSCLYVDDAYRGKGIGKMLLQKVQEICSKNGIEELALLVEEDNTRAKAFYKKIGFVEGFRFLWMSRKEKAKKQPS